MQGTAGIIGTGENKPEGLVPSQLVLINFVANPREALSSSIVP